MASGRCLGCGGGLPAGARFCPRCGVGVDEVPLLPLLDTEEAATSADADGEGRRASKGMRTVLALVAGLVVLLLGLSAFAGGDDEPDDDADEQAADDEAGERSTTTRPSGRSTTTGQSTTTTTLPGLLPDGGVPEAAGAVAIHASGDQLVVADLGTGSQIVVPGPADDVQELTIHGTHVLAITMSGETHLFDLNRASTWTRFDLDVGTGLGSLNNGSVISFGETTVGAIHDRGALSVWELPASLQSWGALGLIGGEVVLNSADGVFLFDRDGTGRRIWRGSALATNGHLVLVVACDDSFECSLKMIDARGVVESTLPPLPEGFVIDNASMSPDGGSVLVGGRRISDGSGEFETYRSDGQSWTAAGTAGAWSLSQATWILSSGAAVWRTPDAAAVHVVPAEGDPLDIRLQSRPGFGYGSVAVTTIDVLPEAWRAELAG